MVERVHFYKNCLLQMLQFMVAYFEACLSDFYLAATGVYIWFPFSEIGSTDIPFFVYFYIVWYCSHTGALKNTT